MRLRLLSLLAASLLLAGQANANLVTNPGFETGDATGWTTSGSTIVQQCAFTVMGCAPGGGTYHAGLNIFVGDNGNSSFNQNVTLPGPGTYFFGAYVSFGTNSAPGNFAQGQISLSVQPGNSPSETVGFDPNALNGQFTIPGNGGYSFTPYFLMTDTLIYGGVGPTSAIINVNVQDFTPDNGQFIALIFDNVFVEAVPEPASLALFAAGLTGLGLARRRKDKAA